MTYLSNFPHILVFVWVAFLTGKSHLGSGLFGRPFSISYCWRIVTIHKSVYVSLDLDLFACVSSCQFKLNIDSYWTDIPWTDIPAGVGGGGIQTEDNTSICLFASCSPSLSVCMPACLSTCQFMLNTQLLNRYFGEGKVQTEDNTSICLSVSCYPSLYICMSV